MAFNFADTRVTALTPADKSVGVLAVKLGSSDFTTGGANSVKAVLPADSSITSFRVWVKTALSGGGITAATLSIGIPGAATTFVNASTTAAGTAGTYTVIPTVSNIFQNYDPANRTDISLLFTGTATTGNPTAGEMYVLIEYVR